MVVHLSKPDPVILIIAAASGTGKSSLAKALVSSEADAVLSISHTTRGIGRNEVDGREYFFVSEQSFLKMVEAGYFVEYANVYGHYYGTSRKTIESSLDSGLSVVLDIDWQGAQQVASQFDCAVRVFLLPPSISTLKSRLTRRKRDSDSAIQTRLQMAIDDMNHCAEFDHIILNDNFNAALQDLKSLLPGSSGITRPLPEDLFSRLNIVT